MADTPTPKAIERGAQALYEAGAGCCHLRHFPYDSLPETEGWKQAKTDKATLRREVQAVVAAVNNPRWRPAPRCDHG